MLLLEKKLLSKALISGLCLILISGCTNQPKTGTNMTDFFKQAGEEALGQDSIDMAFDKQTMILDSKSMVMRDIKEKRFDEALLKLDSLSNIYPNAQQWSELKVFIAFEKQDYSLADSICTEMLSSGQTQSFDVFHNRAYARAFLGRCEEAKEDILYISRINPTSFAQDSVQIFTMCKDSVR